MKLNKVTPAIELKIKSPKWSTREFLVPTYKVGEHNIITFTDETAKRSFPLEYYVEGKNIRKYTIQNIKSKAGTNIRMYHVSLSKPQSKKQTDWLGLMNYAKHLRKL